MTVINETNLFRFMAVRPVQTRNRKLEGLRFLRQPVTAAPPTRFQARLRAAGTREAARTLARTFIGSDEYLGDRVESDAKLLVLAEVYQAMKAAATQGNAGSLADVSGDDKLLKNGEIKFLT